ncbi:MAG: arsenic transporter [Acidobacteriaceae bacterium]|nr:arsenic transporter [Acidobacteriaceae bacterium]MBV9296535.1 arsenic transporter [Acidobacteriaceae bacterium]MBV9763328.1 arsenic transporter [Acidobacteriaceae bacterium]
MLPDGTNHGHSLIIWLVSLASIALVLIRPKGLPEAWWAVIGAGTLVLCRLISPLNAMQAVENGVDVYLFLIGMMVMSELARREGVFDWAAQHAVKASKGSRSRLFVLIYCVGALVTIFLSNDATAVVLTPAVLAAIRTAEAEPLPYLLICAFIANAASFVLPISNPANLVVYSHNLPPLGRWLSMFTLPSVAAVLVTFAALRWLARTRLRGGMKTDVAGQALSQEGKVTLGGISFLAITLMTASAFHLDLGAPAFGAGLLVAAVICFRDRRAAGQIVKQISWSVIPLVAGLFVIVEALNSAGALPISVEALEHMKSWPPMNAAFSSAFGVALLSNVMNNLPTGLVSGSAIKAAGATGPLRHAVLIGVDLGPNLSITGSLATILWLIAIRREGEEIGFWKFLKWGIFVMPPALAMAVLATVLIPQR